MRLIATAVALACSLGAFGSNGIEDSLVPKPQAVRVAPGQELALDPALLPLRMSAPTAESQARLAEHAREVLDGAGFELGKDAVQAVAGPFAFAAGARALPGDGEAAGLPEAAQNEGYRLSVGPDGLLGRAEREAGLFYALMTFGQLLTYAQAQGTGLPCVEIEDWPAIAMRGYSEDYGRNQVPTLEDHKRSIRTLARFKMNTYLWFIEPDHFKYAFDPDLGSSVDRFTFDEVRELVAYAKRYHIQVIPTVELLGHMECTLADPDYRSLGEIPGGSDLCPTSEATRDLVRAMVGEIAPAFESAYFHCGLDESFSVGTGQSAAAVKERGLEQVYADYYTWLNDVVKSHGKTMMMYADIALSKPAMLELLPKDIVMMFWDYAPRDRFEGLDTLRAAGFPLVTLSGVWDWNNVLPQAPPAFRNIEALAAQTREAGGFGAFVSNWGDGYRGASGFNLNEWNWPVVAYAAACGWNPTPVPIERFVPAFALQYFGTADAGLAQALVRLAKAQGDLAWYGRARAMFQSDPIVTICGMAEADESTVAFWERLRTEAGAAREALGRPPRNADVLASVDVAARMLHYAADLALLCRKCAVEGTKPDADREAMAAAFEQRVETADAIWRDYSAAWNATNRPLNLQELDKVHAWAQERLKATAAAIRAGDVPARYDKGLRMAFHFDGEGEAAWQASPGGMTLQAVEGVESPVVANGIADIHPGRRREAVDTARLLDFKTVPFLVEIWVRHYGQQEHTFGSSLLSYGEGGHGWRLGLNAKHQVLFTLYGVRDAMGPNAVVPPDGAWHHVAVNFHGCRFVDFYIDGKLADRVEMEGAPDSPGNPLLRLGNEIALVTPVQAEIDRIRISAGVFTAEELDSEWQSPATPN